MNANKILPCLWFHTENGSLAGLIKYFKSVFVEIFYYGPIMSLGNTPSGNTEMCEVFIFEKMYNFMSSATEHHGFNDALAFAIYCADHIEIDKYWNYFTKEGKEVQCGWCMDKFGLR